MKSSHISTVVLATLLILLTLTFQNCGQPEAIHDPFGVAGQIEMEGKTFIGDMLVDQEIADTLYGVDEKMKEGDWHGKSEAVSLDLRGRRLWPNDTVPYQFASSVSSTVKNRFRAAADKWQKATGVRFIARNGHKTYLQVTTHLSGCWAEFGAPKSGAARINLGNGCHTVGIAMHELGHVLSLVHEHQRPNRDRFVQVNWNNVKSSGNGNFTKYADSQLSRTYGGYDFRSIMHYARTNWSKNGGNTLSAKGVYSGFNNVIGKAVTQNNRLSWNDVEIVRSLYGTSLPQQNDGFRPFIAWTKKPTKRELGWKVNGSFTGFDNESGIKSRQCRLFKKINQNWTAKTGWVACDEPGDMKPDSTGTWKIRVRFIDRQNNIASINADFSVVRGQVAHFPDFLAGQSLTAARLPSNRGIVRNEINAYIKSGGFKAIALSKKGYGWLSFRRPNSIVKPASQAEANKIALQACQVASNNQPCGIWAQGNKITHDKDVFLTKMTQKRTVVGKRRLKVNDLPFVTGAIRKNNVPSYTKAKSQRALYLSLGGGAGYSHSYSNMSGALSRAKTECLNINKYCIEVSRNGDYTLTAAVIDAFFKKYVQGK